MKPLEGCHSGDTTRGAWLMISIFAEDVTIAKEPTGLIIM